MAEHQHPSDKPSSDRAGGDKAKKPTANPALGNTVLAYGAAQPTAASLTTASFNATSGKPAAKKHSFTASLALFPPEFRRLGVVFQDHLLFPHLSVEANLRYGQRHRTNPRAVLVAPGPSPVQDLLSVRDMSGFAGTPSELFRGLW